MDHVRVPTVVLSAVPDPVPSSLHVLDVREEVEWTHGHIDGALHIPLAEVPSRMGEVLDGQTLVVCKIGGRSSKAVAYLQAQGLDAVNLDGGMLDWADAGRPMVSENGSDPKVV